MYISVIVPIEFTCTGDKIDLSNETQAASGPGRKTDMARITKKQIYAKYGIEYKSGKILSPVGEWINPLLPVGTNIKLNGKPKKGVKRTNVMASWSMLHGCETYTKEDFYKRAAAVMKLYKVDSIKASCPCHCEHCYCDSGCYNFDSTKACNLRKLILARLYMDWTERAIKAQLEADHVNQVRIHAAGRGAAYA